MKAVTPGRLISPRARKQAREDMKPHQEEVERAKAEVVSLKEKLKALKANGDDKAKKESLEAVSVMKRRMPAKPKPKWTRLMRLSST